MNMHEFMCSYVVKMIKNTNNLFKQQFLMHSDYVLCKIRVLESSIEYLIIKIYNKQY
jgi:hypothetical protein